MEAESSQIRERIGQVEQDTKQVGSEEEKTHKWKEELWVNGFFQH